MSYPDPKDLDAVHADMNKYPYAVDSAQWIDIRQRGSGDCKDYTLADLHALLDLGWPLDSLKIGTCLVEPANRIEGQTHAILVVDDDKVLDIRQPNVCTIEDLQAVGYEPIEIQESGGSRTYVQWIWRQQ